MMAIMITGMRKGAWAEEGLGMLADGAENAYKVRVIFVIAGEPAHTRKGAGADV
jgi:hypothetical protein